MKAPGHQEYPGSRSWHQTATLGSTSQRRRHPLKQECGHKDPLGRVVPLARMPKDTFTFLSCSLGLQQLPEDPSAWHSFVFSSEKGWKLLELFPPVIEARVQCGFWRVFSADDHLCFASLAVKGSAAVTGLTVLPPVHPCLRGESMLVKQVQASAKMNIRFY